MTSLLGGGGLFVRPPPLPSMFFLGDRLPTPLSSSQGAMLPSPKGDVPELLQELQEQVLIRYPLRTLLCWRGTWFTPWAAKHCPSPMEECPEPTSGSHSPCPCWWNYKDYNHEDNSIKKCHLVQVSLPGYLDEIRTTHWRPSKWLFTSKPHYYILRISHHAQLTSNSFWQDKSTAFPGYF